MVLKEGYPCLEAQVNLAEPTRKLLAAYDTVSRKREGDAYQYCTYFDYIYLTYI